MRWRPAIGIASLVLLALSGPARAGSSSAFGAGAAIGTALGVLCGAASLAEAEQVTSDETGVDEYARRGWLLGLGGSYAVDVFQWKLEDEFERQLGLATGVAVDESHGLNARLGYRCHPRFSAEVGVEWIESFDADLHVDGLGVGAIDIEPVVITSNLKIYLLTGRFQPFALAGAGIATTETRVGHAGLGRSTRRSETDLAGRFGGGADFYLTESVVLSLGVDYVRPFAEGRPNDLDYVSAVWSFLYRF